MKHPNTTNSLEGSRKYEETKFRLPATSNGRKYLLFVSFPLDSVIVEITVKWELMCIQFACTSKPAIRIMVLAVLLFPLIWSPTYRLTVSTKIEPNCKLVKKKINLNCVLLYGIRLMYHSRSVSVVSLLQQFKMNVLLTPLIVNL